MAVAPPHTPARLIPQPIPPTTLLLPSKDIAIHTHQRPPHISLRAALRVGFSVFSVKTNNIYVHTGLSAHEHVSLFQQRERRFPVAIQQAACGVSKRGYELPIRGTMQKQKKRDTVHAYLYILTTRGCCKLSRASPKALLTKNNDWSDQNKERDAFIK